MKMIHHIKSLSLIMLGIALFFFIGCMSQKTSLYSQNSEKLSGSDQEDLRITETMRKASSSSFQKRIWKRL